MKRVSSLFLRCCLLPQSEFSFKTHNEEKAGGYTGMEISGAAGQCQPRVRVSGTLAGKMTQRLHAEAQGGPGSLEKENSLMEPLSGNLRPILLGCIHSL